MKGSKALLVTVGMTAGLLALSVAVRGKYARLAAEHWRRQLDAVPDQGVSILVRQVAELGEPGIPVLVDALGSERQCVARAGKQAIDDQLDRWRMLPATASSSKLAVLADAMAERVGQFGPSARNDAAELACRILLWPPDSRVVDRARVIASCEAVFRAASARNGLPPDNALASRRAVSPQGAGADAARGQTPAADDLADAGRLLVDLSRFPGGGLPVESLPRPDAPERVGYVLSGEDAQDEPPHDDPRRLDLPAAVQPLSTWRESDWLSAASEPAQGSDAAVSSDRLGKSNLSRSLSPTERGDGMPPGPADGFPAMETVALIQWLDYPQESRAAEARAELVRRGFTETLLEIARRLHDPDAEVRIRLARQLPGLQGVDPLPWLLQLTGDPNPEVRLVAIGLIATTNDAGLLERIEQVARDDSDPRIRRQAELIAARRATQRR